MFQVAGRLNRAGRRAEAKWDRGARQRKRQERAEAIKKQSKAAIAERVRKQQDAAHTRAVARKEARRKAAATI